MTPAVDQNILWRRQRICCRVRACTTTTSVTLWANLARHKAAHFCFFPLCIAYRGVHSGRWVPRKFNKHEESSTKATKHNCPFLKAADAGE